MTTGTATGIPTATTQPDGSIADTGSTNVMEKFNMYPVGARTTSMKGILLFDFAQLRDGFKLEPQSQLLDQGHRHHKLERGNGTERHGW